MLTGQHLHLPTRYRLFLKRRVSINKRLHLRLHHLHPIRNSRFTLTTIHTITRFILITTNSPTLLAYGQFCDLELLLLIFEGHHYVGINGVVVVVDCVLVAVGGAEAVEAFHAYE